MNISEHSSCKTELQQLYLRNLSRCFILHWYQLNIFCV